MPHYEFRRVDPTSDEATDLLNAHLSFAAEHSPPEHVHAMGSVGLAAEDVSFFGLGDESRLVAIGALRRIDDSHAEIKSMHTRIEERGRGLGKSMVSHLLRFAREHGYQRVSLETGTMDAFTPARRLYESMGFRVTEPFGDYWDNEHSVCMTVDIHDLT